MIFICLTIPGRIISVVGETAVVDYGKEKRTVSIVDGRFKKGDYVIVTNKIIIQKIPKKEAMECINTWKK